MSLWRAGLRSDVRRGVAHWTWWAGQVVCGLCCLAAIVVLIGTGFAIDGQVCAAALLLIGMLALIGGRAALMIGARRPRRRLDVY